MCILALIDSTVAPCVPIVLSVPFRAFPYRRAEREWALGTTETSSQLNLVYSNEKCCDYHQNGRN